MYLVIRERMTREALAEPGRFRQFQSRFDDWMRQHGARFDEVRHYVTVVGDPMVETWLHYPDYATLEAERQRLCGLEGDPEWRKLNHELNTYLERIESRIVEDLNQAPSEF